MEIIEIPAEDQLLSHVIEKHQHLFRNIVLHDSLLESQGLNDNLDLNVSNDSENYATASTSSSSKSTAYRGRRSLFDNRKIPLTTMRTLERLNMTAEEFYEAHPLGPQKNKSNHF